MDAELSKLDGGEYAITLTNGMTMATFKLVVRGEVGSNFLDSALAHQEKVSGRYLQAATPQPMPVGDGEIVLHHVIADLKGRGEVGFRKYGTMLRTNNGRDGLVDAYQEVLDLAVYLKQVLMEGSHASD